MYTGKHELVKPSIRRLVLDSTTQNCATDLFDLFRHDCQSAKSSIDVYFHFTRRIRHWHFRFFVYFFVGLSVIRNNRYRKSDELLLTKSSTNGIDCYSRFSLRRSNECTSVIGTFFNLGTDDTCSNESNSYEIE